MSGRYLEREVDAVGEKPVIEATCGYCSTKAIYPAEGIQLTIRKTNRITQRNATFEFFCTGCYRENTQRVEPAVVDELVKADLVIRVLEVPPEVRQAAEIEMAIHPLSLREIDQFASALSFGTHIAQVVLMEVDRDVLRRAE